MHIVKSGDTIQALKSMKTGESIIVENIHFDTGSAKLLVSSRESLESLLSIMKEVPKLEIELSGHTDNKGEKELNLALSEKRAQAVANYLLKNGVEQKRLKVTGFGETNPITENNTMMGRQRNRRVEIKVLAR